MSDNIPFEILVEIMKRLPVKSLIRLRSVSKTWRSTIDSSDLVVAHYHHYHTQQQQQLQHHLLVLCDDGTPNCVSFADNHTFPHHKVSITIPMLVTKFKYPKGSIIGSSRGLLCFYGKVPNNHDGGSIPIAVIWNPAVRRSIPIVVPKDSELSSSYLFFGVCRVTADPKIVKITYIISESDMKVEVFTLSTGVWREKCRNLPPKSIRLHAYAVDVDGWLYWLATERISMDDGYTRCNVIISLDITSEEFTRVNLPDSLARDHWENLCISKLRESLVVSKGGEDGDNVINVWLMEGVVAKSFSKLYSVNVGTTNEAYVRGFRRSGEPLIEFLEEHSEDDIPFFKFGVYDPHSKRINCFWTHGISSTFDVYPYMETLLPLNQMNLAVYNDMESIRFLDDFVS